MTSLVVVGLAIAGGALAGRAILRSLPHLQKATGSIPKQFLDMKGYYKGGFDPVMTKSEASRILGVSSSAPKSRVKEAHKRLMMINHPDRGGSQYMATKINEAKNILEK